MHSEGYSTTDKFHKACEKVSEICEQTLHGKEQNNAYGKHERDTRQCVLTEFCCVLPHCWKWL